MAEPSHPSPDHAEGRIDDLESGFTDLARHQLARDLDHEVLELERDAYGKLIACAKFLLPRKLKLSPEKARQLARMKRDAHRWRQESGWYEWEPHPPKETLLEKAWPADNHTIARRWVLGGWVPTIDPVGRTLGQEGVEALEPESPVHRVIRALYLKLLEAASWDTVIDEVGESLMRLRSELEPGDALPWDYFPALAAQIGDAHRSRRAKEEPKEEVVTASAPAKTPVDEVRVARDDRGGFHLSRTINGQLIDDVTIRVGQLARLFEIVSSADRPLRWEEVESLWGLASNWKGIVEPDTLRKYGRRLREVLTDAGFGQYWRYTADEVAWRPKPRRRG